MQALPVFLSLVVVIRNQKDQLENMLGEISGSISKLVTDYELIVIDNASSDESIDLVKKLTSESGLPNLQVYALTKEVDYTTASWVGVENALGDFVAVFNPQTDAISFLSEMLNKAMTGRDVVFASNKQKGQQTLVYKIGHRFFNLLYKWFNDVNLSAEAPEYRVLSRRLVNFILQHAQPVIAYRHLPATGGFARAILHYDRKIESAYRKRVKGNIDRGIGLLISTTRAPMRLVTSLCLFGAFSNIFYSIYVVGIAIWKPDVAPGWTTLSLQQSGMFFLLSLVMLVLSEYILQMVSLSNSAPLYHVAQEFTSTKMTRLSKLNVEEARDHGALSQEQRFQG